MKSKVEINGIEYTKSSLCRGKGCVGVANNNDQIVVVNTKTQPLPIEFTKYEWKLFIEGVKRGEFDVFGE